MKNMEDKIEQLKSDIHDILDEQAMSFNPEYSFGICMKFQGMADNLIDDFVKENLTKHNNSFIQNCFKKIFPEYDDFPEGHRLLELQKLLEEGSPK